VKIRTLTCPSVHLNFELNISAEVNNQSKG